MVGINNFTSKKHNFYNSTVQAILICGGDCYKKVVACVPFFIDMVSQGEKPDGKLAE